MNSTETWNSSDDMSLTEFMGILGRARLYLTIVPICVTALFLYIYYDDAIYYNTDVGIELLTDDGEFVSFLKQKVAPTCGVQVIDSKKRASLKARAISKEEVLNSIACARSKIDTWEHASNPSQGIKALDENETARQVDTLTEVLKKIQGSREDLNMSPQEYAITLITIRSRIIALSPGKKESDNVKKYYKYEKGEESLTINEERPKWWNVLILSYVGSVLMVLGIALVGNELNRLAGNFGEKYTLRDVLKAMWVKWNV